MEENRLIRENERLDDLQNGYMLIQNPSPGYGDGHRDRPYFIKGKVSPGKIHRSGDTAGKRGNGEKERGL